jgi:hypothetical protein
MKLVLPLSITAVLGGALILGAAVSHAQPTFDDLNQDVQGVVESVENLQGLANNVQAAADNVAVLSRNVAPADKPAVGDVDPAHEPRNTVRPRAGLPSVDWANTTLAVPVLGGCPTAQDVTFVEGQAETEEHVYRIGGADAQFADITGDGAVEAVVMISCGPKNSHFTSALVAYSVDGEALAPLAVVAQAPEWTQQVVDFRVWHGDVAVAMVNYDPIVSIQPVPEQESEAEAPEAAPADAPAEQTPAEDATEAAPDEAEAAEAEAEQGPEEAAAAPQARKWVEYYRWSEENTAFERFDR